MITGKIDGKEVTVEQGTTILVAAQSIGIEIPHFCYHPSIGIEGSCRMCLVEIKDNPKLQISCAIPLCEGMEVLTDTEKVKKAREGVLEFLLANHPLDCPICDKGGECPLQDYSFAYGTGISRYEEPKRHLVKHKIIGDHIMFDSERCILCSRCSRYYRDIVGVHELVIKKRGHNSEITTFADKPLSSGFSGNLGDFCPVGALTTREFRFSARPWELKTIDSSCVQCGLNCSIQIWKDKNINRKQKKIRRLTPRYNSKVNDWWLCDRGRFGYSELLDSNRIKTPLMREEDDFKELTMSEANLELKGILSDLLSRTGRESFKIVSSTDITNEEAWILRKIAQTSERAGTVLVNVTKRAFELYNFLKENGLATESVEDIRQSQNILLVGTDILKTHPVLYLHFRKMFKDKSKKLLVTKDCEFPDEKLVSERIGGDDTKRKELLDQAALSLKYLKNTTVILGEQWIDSDIFSQTTDFLKKLKGEGILRNAVLLRKDDFNTQGILNISSTYMAFEEEINSVLEGKSAKELLLIGDDIIEKIVKDSRFSADNYNFICMCD